MKTKINQLAAQIIIYNYYASNCTPNITGAAAATAQLYTKESMAQLETNTLKKFGLDGGATITFDQTEQAYYLQDNQP